jgi:hypothetical protein
MPWTARINRWWGAVDEHRRVVPDPCVVEGSATLVWYWCYVDDDYHNTWTYGRAIIGGHDCR